MTERKKPNKARRGWSRDLREVCLAAARVKQQAPWPLQAPASPQGSVPCRGRGSPPADLEGGLPEMTPASVSSHCPQLPR